MTFPQNRSMLSAAITPVLAFENAIEGAQWLSRVFGFTERLRIGTHRVQLTCGEGAVVAVARQGNAALSGDSLMMRVANVDAHYSHAKECGADIESPPVTHPYGERQYSAVDIGGHRWTFSQTVSDVDPRDWGGQVVS